MAEKKSKTTTVSSGESEIIAPEKKNENIASEKKSKASSENKENETKEKKEISNSNNTEISSEKKTKTASDSVDTETISPEKKVKSISDLPGVGATSAEKLIGAGYRTLENIAVASPAELMEAAGLGEITATKAINAARESLEMGYETADKIQERRKTIGRLTTGSKELDELIGGGVESQSITEVYGKFASGKCVSKDTKLLYFNPDKAHLKSIEEVYENYAVNEKPFDGGFLTELKKPVQVIGIDKKGKTRKVHASNLFKEYCTELKLIKTEKGAELKLTERHPLLTLNEEGIQWKSSGLLKEGDFIGTPQKIEFNEKIFNDETESTENRIPIKAIKPLYKRIAKPAPKKAAREQSKKKRLELKKDLRTMKLILETEAKWEKITSIKTIEYNDWVYDLVVPEIHSFIGGNKPVFLHNTQWCFQLCVTTQLPVEKGGLEGNVLYIDSEQSFRPERIVSIAKHLKLNPEEVLKNIYVARAFNSDHQMVLAEKAEDMIKEKNIKLVIVDSLTSQFRAEFIGRGTLANRQQKLNKHMHTLMKLAEMNNIAVLVTNQVMSRPDILFGDPTAPIGGHVVGHACLDPDTLIQAGNGKIIKIREIKENTICSTDFKELKGKVSAVSFKSKRDNIKESYLIDTGHQINASPNHKFFKLDGFEIKEVKAKDIQKNDYLLQAGKIEIQGDEQEIPKMQLKEFLIVNKKGAELIKNTIKNMGFTREQFCEEMPFDTGSLRRSLNTSRPISMENMNSIFGFGFNEGIAEEIIEETQPALNYRHRPLTVPETFSEELAQTTGYFLGDGNLDQRSLRFRDERREVLEVYWELFKDIFNIEGKYYKVKDKNCWQLSVNSKEIRELFSYIKRNYISLITQSPKPVVKAFIKGFVDAEGHVDKSIRRISIGQKDKEILQIIQMLLLRFGIQSRILKYGAKQFQSLEIFSEDVVKYGKEIGVSAPDKRKQLDKWVKEFSENMAKVIVPIKRGSFWGFLKEMFRHPSKVIQSRNYKHITLHELNEVLEAIKGKEIPEEHKEKIKLLKAIQNREISFGKVARIKKQKNNLPLYDISVPETENYIANGFIVHNSKTRLYLRKAKGEKRVAKLVDSPSLPDGEAVYRVTENGIED